MNLYGLIKQYVRIGDNEMENLFSKLLVSPGPGENIDVSLYGRFVGEWDFDWPAPLGDGTTIRISLQDGSDKWQIIYGCEKGYKAECLIAEEVSGDIIQTGITYDADDKFIRQWNFRNITENSFHWESIRSEDNGRIWNIVCELDAVRRNQSFAGIHKQ